MPFRGGTRHQRGRGDHGAAVTVISSAVGDSRRQPEGSRGVATTCCRRRGTAVRRGTAGTTRGQPYNGEPPKSSTTGITGIAVQPGDRRTTGDSRGDAVRRGFTGIAVQRGSSGTAARGLQYDGGLPGGRRTTGSTGIAVQRGSSTGLQYSEGSRGTQRDEGSTGSRCEGSSGIAAQRGITGIAVQRGNHGGSQQHGGGFTGDCSARELAGIAVRRGSKEASLVACGSV